MKRLASLLAIVAMLFATTAVFSNNASAAAPKKKAATTKTATVGAAKTTGTVVCLTDYIKGETTISKDVAVTKAAAGDPIVLLVAKKIYFVYNEDGTFAGKNLAKFAANKKVIVKGAKKTIAGINYIISTDIQSGD